MSDEQHTDHSKQDNIPQSDGNKDQVTISTDSKLPHLPHRQQASSSQPDNVTPEKEQPKTELEPIKPVEPQSLNTLFHQPSANHQAQEEEVDLGVLPQKTPMAKTATATLIAVAVLVGLAATWFQLNQGTYSLSAPSDQVADTSQVTPTNQPATLGAETNATRTLNLDLKLQPLAQGHYQAWISHEDQTESLGAFKPTDSGAQTLDGDTFAPQVTIATGDKFFVTIEAADTVTDSPSKTIILSGNVDQQNQATLNFNAIDLSQAAGSFLLATPTDNGADPKSGIWFAAADDSKLGNPSLRLPAAPTGWKYEGQVVYKGVAVEVGRFSQPDKADEFNMFTPNPQNTPNVPGEDFLQKAPGQLGMDFPVDLSTGEWKVVVSLEPDQDGHDPTGTDTFFLQPLSADIPQGADSFKDYPLTRDLSHFPSGTAEFK
jgi:hypothetical protein